MQPDPPISSMRDQAGGTDRRLVAAGYALILALALVLATTRLADRPAQLAFDAISQMLATHFPKPRSGNIVIVGIDEASFAAFPEPMAMWHRHIGKFLHAMARATPAAVGIDIVLPTRSYDDLVPGLDGALLQGIIEARAATRIVLGQTIDERGNPRPIHAPFVAALPDSAPGYVLFPEESDGVVRRFSEHLGPDAAAVPTLPGQITRILGKRPHDGWIDYALGPQPDYIPLQQVTRWFDTGDSAALAAAFSGRIVLLGGVTQFEDRKRQPTNLVGWEVENGRRIPGVLIHAQVLKSMLGAGLIQDAPRGSVVMSAAMASLLWFAVVPAGVLVMVLAGFVTIVLGVSAWLLWYGTYFAPAAMLLTGAAALVGRWLLESLLQMRERRMLRSVFSGYVSPPLMREILAGRLTDDLAGSVRVVCVMFADVRGFTRLSESTPPQEVLQLLNRYFERVTKAVHTEGGTLNSIMGDGIMVIFGAPNPLENPSVPAFAAARRILAMLPELNAELAAEGKSSLSIGIGLNVGEAIVGHVGSRDRHDYSAIGDTTNTAARLEGITKEVGYPMVCSAAVFEALGSPPGFVFLGERELRGRAPLAVYGWREPEAG